MRDEGRSGIDRRLDKDRRSGVDARSAEERQLDGERRSGQERRAGLERRGAQLSPAEDAVSKVLSSSSIDEKIDFLVRSSAQVGSALLKSNVACGAYNRTLDNTCYSPPASGKPGSGRFLLPIRENGASMALLANLMALRGRKASPRHVRSGET